MILKNYDESIVSTQTLINTLTKTFNSFILNDMVDKHPAVFIKGSPGVGKSQAIKQIKSNLEKITNKNIYVKDIRLLLYSPLDLNGIPMADEKKERAIWLKPELFDFPKDSINILFLDELTQAPEQIQAAAYQIALDKKLGEHKLPKNTFVVAAGNTLEDLSLLNEMPTALKNRFIHFKIDVNVDEWLIWAKENDIHPELIEFIKNNPTKLATKDFNTESNIIVTPRSYETLSVLLAPFNNSLKDNKVLVKSVLGNNLTNLILNQNKLNKSLTVKDLLSKKINKKLDKISEVTNIIDELEQSYQTYYDNKEQMENVLYFINTLPNDFSLRYLKLILNNPPKSYSIFNLELFNNLMNKYGEMISE